MMKRLFFTAMLFTIILAVFTPLTALGSVVAYRAVATVSMDVPAVATIDGRVVGVMSKLKVMVAWPGQGRVFMSVKPLTQFDTQAAARLAALAASMLAGVDYRGYDFFVELEANTTMVGGPSASGAMAVAFLAALTGANVSSDFSMTGMVMPDFSLGPVGGIPEKLEAAARAGKKVFIIPWGQSVVRDPFTGRVVNVTALGETLGVKVVEASDIVEAYRYATGSELHIEKTMHLKYPDWLSDILGSVAKELASYADERVRMVEEMELRGQARQIVGQLISHVKSLLEKYENASAQGMPYTAASLAFRAAVEAEQARLIALWATRGAQELVKELEKIVGEAVNYTRAVEELPRPRTVEGLQLLVVVRDRVERLVAAVEEARARLAMGDLFSAVKYAAAAYVRALTIHGWIDAYRAAEAHGSQPLKHDRLVDAVNTIVDYAEISASYIESLGLVEAEEIVSSISAARQKLAENDYAGALALAALTLVEASNVLHRLLAVVPDLGSVRSHALMLAGRAEKAGVEPIVPALYIEYGDWLAAQGLIEDALAMFEEAAAYSLILYSLLEAPAPQPLGSTPLYKLVEVTTTKTITVTSRETVTVEKPVTVPVRVDCMTSILAVAVVSAAALALIAAALRRART